VIDATTKIAKMIVMISLRSQFRIFTFRGPEICTGSSLRRIMDDSKKSETAIPFPFRLTAEVLPIK
jgi:hypothetical protein